MGQLIGCYRKTLRFSDMSDRYMSTCVSEHCAASIFRKVDTYCRFLRNVRAVYQNHYVTSQKPVVLTLIAVSIPNITSIFKHFVWIWYICTVSYNNWNIFRKASYCLMLVWCIFYLEKRKLIFLMVNLTIFLWAWEYRQCSSWMIFFYQGATAQVVQGRLIIEDLLLHSDTPHWVWLFWTSDQPEAETSTWHTTITTERYSCPRQDSNPQSQQASGRRPTP